ncbi:MAG: FAD-dependent oxidoreductase, partial [Renibacterium sp.]|nr:FAD-dependent oxidoreductase [Renibacterium sp.]
MSSHTELFQRNTADRPLRVAVIGSGPAGVYAADILTKSDLVKSGELSVSIDLFDRYPAPFGLIRYGVAPDHPRIKGIIQALHKVLDRGDIRFFGNVDYGVDISLADLRKHYDAVIFATGAIDDAALNIPGIDLDGSFGGADFVSWYDGHPDVSREWPLEATEIAVLGNGNVALDVARVLSKHADDLLVTEIPENVYAELKKSPVTDVHVFGRRGPAQIKFTPLELRELSHSKDVDIILYPEDFEFDEASDEAIKTNNQVKTMVNTLTNWLVEQPEESTASRRLHLHFLHNPVEILGVDGKVTGIKFERTELDGTGNARGTGEFVEYPV